uniref:Uncharacterized protein n=1 Tax=Rhizophora mucronata TaxID=61149 RepID=A0A2P2Q2C2_RHIMU
MALMGLDRKKKKENGNSTQGRHHRSNWSILELPYQSIVGLRILGGR